MWPRVCVREGNIYTYSGMTLETISSCVCSQIDLVGLVFFPFFCSFLFVFLLSASSLKCMQSGQAVSS